MPRKRARKGRAIRRSPATISALLAAAAAGFLLGRLTSHSPGPALPPLHGPASTPGDAPTGPASPATELVRVVDGDTLVVLRRPQEVLTENIRLLNVNTPERGRPGYNEATSTLRSLVGAAGSEVQLIYEKDDRPTRDRYGRLLAYVIVNGRNVNVEIVRLGWSRYETGFGPGRFPDEFRAAEAEARAARRGLWGLGG